MILLDSLRALTITERAVVAGLLEGLVPKQIASSLDVNVKTVNSLIAHSARKLGVRGIRGLHHLLTMPKFGVLDALRSDDATFGYKRRKNPNAQRLVQAWTAP